MTWVAVGIGGAGLISGLFGASKQGGVDKAEEGLLNQDASEAKYYNKMLSELMSNPESFLQNPLFQSTLNQGLAGVIRQMAASGYGGSGNMAAALEQYGQSFASGQLMNQEQLLGGLIGSLSGAATGAGSAATAGISSQMGAISGGLDAAGMAGMLLTGQSGGGNGLTSQDLMTLLAGGGVGGGGTINFGQYTENF